MPKHNINEFDQLFRRTIKELAGATSPHRIKLDRIDAKTLRLLTHVTVENKTLTYTKCRIGINNGGNDHYLDELENPAADELVVSRSVTDQELVMTCIGWEKNLI